MKLNYNISFGRGMSKEGKYRKVCGKTSWAADIEH
jgi:hypothetical protein